MANIEDVYKKLIELHKELLEITTVGIVNGATEAKQTEQIDLLTSISETGEEGNVSLNNIDLNTASTIDVLKFIAEQQVITNKYLRKIYNPK
jgi:hypothetical protein